MLVKQVRPVQFSFGYHFVLLIFFNLYKNKGLLLRYCDNEYSENLVHTINVDFKEKRMKYNDGTAAVRVWDTAGQERYRTV